MASLWQIIILGIIQGITEWLPISSSGHLVIFQYFFDIEEPVIFDLFLHMGSLLVVFLVFWREIKQLILSFFIKEYKKYRKIAYYIIIGTIPTALLGYFFEDMFESFFSSLLAVGIALIITGFLLYFCERFEKNNSITVKSALVMGIMQGLAITPGISRSGSTISTALYFGVKREEAVKFSFLLFIPAMLGATILQSKDIVFNSIEWTPIIIGTLVAVIVGYLSLKLLILIVKKKRLRLFSYYCWIVGITTLILSIKF